MAGSNFVGNLKQAAVETGAEELTGLNCCSGSRAGEPDLGSGMVAAGLVAGRRVTFRLTCC